MPRISTDNYDTVASWNGSQDLFVVEQPDGTKVATPAMVKQFIEAGDFEATGEVKDGHGNILKDVVAEIGDLSQTGLTGDSVAEQLATAKQQIWERIKCGVITSPSSSVTANNHMLVDVPLSAPLPSTLVAVFVVFTPNSAWLFANVQDYNDTRIRIGVYNTHPSATIEGVFKVAYLYT